MTPTDPRHGRRAGYQAHLKDGEKACEACLRGRGREDKQLRYEHHRGVRLEYSCDEVRDLIEPWLAMGLSYGAIGNAAGLGSTHGSRLADRIGEQRPFRRVTFEALTTVAEDDFHGTALLYSHLTRQRIYSLMAAGHALRAMPILETGQWRHRRHITVTQARRIRDYYTAHEHTSGTSPISAGKAQGHPLPAAWDDPGTLAWPLGWTEPIVPAGPDVVVVERVLAGDWHLPCSASDRAEVARRWHAAGRSLRSLRLLTSWKPERYFKISAGLDAGVGEAA